MKLPMEKMFINIHKYGNTTAATIPIALCEAIEEGKLVKGDNIILTAFGAGYTWASALLNGKMNNFQKIKIFLVILNFQY